MKINVKNEMKITAAIEQVQKGCRVRTIYHNDVVKSVREIELFLERLLPAKYWIGLKFDVDTEAQSFPSAYNGTPVSTQFRIERFPSGWFVTIVSREKTMAPSNRIYPINIHERNNEIIEYLSTSGKAWS